MPHVSADKPVVYRACEVGLAVGLALAAAKTLESEGVATQVVSAPCLEWFELQDEKYRNEVLPQNCLKVSVEAGIAQGWHRWIGSDGLTISLEHFGASASAGTLFQNFGFSEKNICEKVRARLK